MSIAHGEKYVFKGGEGEGGPIMVYGGISAAVRRPFSRLNPEVGRKNGKRHYIHCTASRLPALGESPGLKLGLGQSH